MKMPLKLILVFTVGLLTYKSNAQDHHCSEKHQRHEKWSPEVMLQKLDAKLHLNKTQEKRVLTLLENKLAQRKILKAKRQSIHKKEWAKMEVQMKAVLNQDQFEMLHKLKAERHKNLKSEHCNSNDKTSCYKRKAKHPNKLKPEERLNKLTESLGLTPDQQTAIREIFKEKHAELKRNHPELRKERKQLKAHFERDMKVILTPEQFKTFKLLKEEHKMKTKRLIKS